ncbi:hypothetical protein JTB14_003602 [Gonioctena quinquepunctata]|nr:hypothetical protein JTB14_003602 [Gonioctena quinquepunctata]
MRHDIKAFERFANGKRKTIGIPPELSYNGEVSSSGGGIANLFAEYFSTVYCNKAGVTHVHTFSNSTLNLSTCPLSISDVYLKLSELSPLKSPGPDGIPLNISK